MRGKFIVIEGTDGTGKGTQFEHALARMQSEGLAVMPTDFPRYGKPSAFFVEQYLTGKYGSSREVPPRVASLFYALDRYDAAPEMKAWLAAGKHILSNRYTTSSLGHQAGKAKDEAGRRAIVEYIERLEYAELEVPKPDLVILLKLHPFVAQQLIAMKGERGYLHGGKKDIHESDLAHLEKAAESYIWVAHRDATWKVVDCAKEGVSEEKMLDPRISPLEKVKTIDEIHELVWREIVSVVEKRP